MESRRLGKTELQVPTAGMGTWRTFDVQGERALHNVRRIVDTALAADANFFDSSPMYGAAESVLSQTLQGRRNKVLIATKVWASARSEGQAQMKHALQLFDNYIDLYQVHNLVNWREYLPLLEHLHNAGQVRA